LGLIRLRQRLRRDKLGLNWVYLAAGGGEIGFVWLCFGLKLALFSQIAQFDIFS
jgi:hypothetical protein